MLTNADCKNATCPLDKKRERLACSGGLYLEVSPAGSKRWFWKYRKDGKEGRMALGSYPEVGPKDAREARDAARQQKADGRDPVQVRKVEKRGCGGNLGLLGKVVHVFLRRPHSSRQALHQTRQTHWRDHSSAGVPDKERAQELAPRIRPMQQFTGGLCAFKAEVFKRAEKSGRPALPKP